MVINDRSSAVLSGMVQSFMSIRVAMDRSIGVQKTPTRFVARMVLLG